MGFADIMKNGWHPEKASGGSSSSSGGSSGGLKSSVLGKFSGSTGSSTSSSQDQSNYRAPSKPISELTDARLFPPPPKHREYHPDAGSAAISPEYSYLYQPAMERKRQEEQRQPQQQQWRQTWQPGQTQQYQPPGQPQYQQPGLTPQYQAPTSQQSGQPAYQPPVAAQPGYQPPQPTYQSPAQPTYQQPQSHQMPQQTYQPPMQPIPSAKSPPLPQRGPMPSLPPRNVASPGYQQPAYQPPQTQFQQPSTPAYQSPQQPPVPTYQQPTVTTSYESRPPASSYQQPAQPFVRGHGYSQSVADGRPDSVSPPPISQPTPTYPNFASEISRARAGFSSTSPAPTPAGQRVPSGHRQTQSMSIAGKKAPPPPPKPKNPALRGSPASPVVGQSSFPGAFPEQNGHAESNMNNNTDTGNGLRVVSGRPGFQDSSTRPAKPPPLATRPPAMTPQPAPAPTTPTLAPAPAADSQQTQWAAPQVDLELEKRWYAMGTNPTKLLQLPSFVSGLTHTYAVAVGGNTKTIILCVRFPDLSRTKFRIEVDRYDDKNVSAQRVDFPPPARPGASDLDAAASGFGENVAKFVEANVGQQIGNGECWTAASEALRFSGAMPSCGFVHGPAVWTFDSGTGARTGDEASLRRGDILQFKNARFRKVDGSSGRVVEEKYVGAPDHTAVVVAVHSVAPVVVVTVLEQNVGGVRTVQQGSYGFGDMAAGDVVAYRPFWKEWAGELDTSWP
ncbi:hypothetical protein V1506DRAFT_535741 [Lipomyces tetrasporus]